VTTSRVTVLILRCLSQYGDFYPKTQDGRLFAFFFIPLGVGVLLQTIAAIVALQFNHQFEKVENVAAILRSDLDGDGEITEAEFKLLMLTRLNCKPEAYIMDLLTKQFEIIDITGDGTLSKAVSVVACSAARLPSWCANCLRNYCPGVVGTWTLR